MENVEVHPATYPDLLAMLKESPAPTAPVSQPFIGSLGAHAPGSSSNVQEGELQRSTPNAEPIIDLRLLSSVNPPIVTARGVVIATTPALFVQDSTGGLEVPGIQIASLKIGDEVQAAGVAEPRDFGSILRQAKVRLLWAGAPIPPLSVTASQAATGSFGDMYVELKGYLRSKERRADNTLVVNLEDGRQTFQAIMNGGRAAPVFDRLKPGSTLMLRGVCVVDSRYTHNLTPFALLLRSTDDVNIVAGPPWWSAGHLVGVFIGFLLLALPAQAIYSYIERWRLRAVLGERHRLAHEMHDTLAQSFAGIGFQLEALRSELSDRNGRAPQHLELAHEMVRHGHEEARRNIATLRPEFLQTIGLLSSLERSAAKMVAGGAVEVRASSSGDPRGMPLLVSDTLFRIGQEAIANAVRHSSATLIDISLHFCKKNMVELRVEDNGNGFVNQSGRPGFGLRGMQERARIISAAFEIQSKPGQGTRVQINANLPPRLTLATFPQHFWQSLRNPAFK